MDYNKNTHSISDLLTPFKKINQKKSFLVNKVELRNKKPAKSPQMNNLENSSKLFSLSTLIHNVSSYKKEKGEDLNIDVESIKPRNLQNLNKSAKASYDSKIIYSNDKFKNLLRSKKNNFTINLYKENNVLSAANIMKSIENDSIDNFNSTTPIKNESKDFYTLFPIEKLSRFETKFIILMTKIKNSKYMKEEYLKWIDDFKTSPFYEFSLNNKNIKNKESINLMIKSSTNLIVLSIIAGFWVENNYDTVNNNEMLIKFLSELTINNHQLYLLLCLYIILEGKFMLWSQVNGKIIRLLEQIKTYLNQILSDFNNKELAIKEIKNANARVVRSIHKILNFENLFCPDISNYLCDINTIDISKLYELFEKMQKKDFYINNYNKTMSKTINNYYSSYQIDNNGSALETKINDSNTIKKRKIYIKKINNYNSKKVQNKNRIINIIINNNNNGDISENNITKNNTVFDSDTNDSKQYITVNLRKYGVENNFNDNKVNKYKESIKNLNKNKSYLNDLTSHIRNNLSNDTFTNTNKNNNSPKNKSSVYQINNYNNKYHNLLKNKFLSKFNLTNNNIESLHIPIKTDIHSLSNTINNNYEPLTQNNLYENNDNIIYIQKKAFKPIYPYLPKNISGKKFTLVLDLDETLVQSRMNVKKTNKDKKVILRPGLFEFLNKVSPMFELIIWTVATKDYADYIIDIIEERKKYFSYILYREYATNKNGHFLKDLTKLGRDLSKVIIVDDKTINFSLQKENGILIKPFLGTSWECRNDTVLYDLFKILTKIILIKSQDAREGIQKYKYEIQQKISKNNDKNNSNDNDSENKYQKEMLKTEINEKEEFGNKKNQKKYYN